jgi:hypothetical protein
MVLPIWDAVSIYDGGDVFIEQISKVSKKQRVLFSCHWAQSEIRNGGLRQFFSNSTGVLAPEAVEAFEAIGMSIASNAIYKAMQFFGPHFPRERDVRNNRLEEYEAANEDDCDPFVEFDDLFFDAIEKECGGFEVAANAFANQG